MPRKVNHRPHDYLARAAQGTDRHAAHCRARLAAGGIKRLRIDTSSGPQGHLRHVHTGAQALAVYRGRAAA
jgi:predicted NUDIX family phosphoesterase